ncbi:MAG: hypothetical protein WDN69_30770 [Aliidongia sp.]
MVTDLHRCPICQMDLKNRDSADCPCRAESSPSASSSTGETHPAVLELARVLARALARRDHAAELGERRPGQVVPRE